MSADESPRGVRELERQNARSNHPECAGMPSFAESIRPGTSLFLDGYGTVVVAVCAVRMVQMAVDEIVDMVAVRNSGMPAVGSMHVAVRVAAAFMVGCARARIGTADRQLMLFDLSVGQGMMQMSIVQIVDVTLMLDGRMTAIGPVLVRVILMHRRRHFALLCRQRTSF
jgi:hypothetical protein